MDGRKVMAAYRRVDDLRLPAGWLPVHGISSGPKARYQVWETFTFTFFMDGDFFMSSCCDVEGNVKRCEEMNT